MEERVTFEFRDSAFNGRITTFAVVNRQHIELEEFFDDSFYLFEAQ